MQIKVGIVGGTGYAGVDLLRLLSAHPAVAIKSVTSRAEAGVPIGTFFPSLREYSDQCFEVVDGRSLCSCDVVFFSTPHGVAMGMVPELLAAGVKVVDLSADFRLREAALFERWYGMPHACPDLLRESVYGLCELNRDAIAHARCIANPGCYPTAVQLALAPLMKAGLAGRQRIHIDAKSGVSGAGREVKTSSLFGEVAGSFRAYGFNGHRHWPEIEQGLTDIADHSVAVIFIPHLVPMNRGIEATIYAPLDVSEGSCSEKHLIEVMRDFYTHDFFVSVGAEAPDTRSVRGSNHCRIGVRYLSQHNTVVLSVVIDNLVKGAAGQAVQNMNLLFALPERCGLDHIPLSP